MAQTIGEAFYIYRNDGQFNAFFRDEVISIDYSYEDTDENTYDEVVTQIVNTADSVYKIPLAAIDSVSFVQQEMEFQPDVMRMDASWLPYVVEITDNSISFLPSTPTVLLPQQGQVLVTETFESPFETGFSGRVKRKDTYPDRIVFEVENVLLSDIYKRLVTVGISSSEGAEENVTRRSRRIWGINTDHGFTFPLMPIVDLAVGPVSISCTPTITMKYIVCLWEDNLKDYLDIRFYQTYDGSVSINANLEKSFTPEPIWIGPGISVPTPVPGLYGRVQWGGFFRATGSVQLSATRKFYREGVSGFVYSEGSGFKKINEWKNPPEEDWEASISIDGSISAGLAGRLQFGIVHEKLASADITLYVGPEISGHAELKATELAVDKNLYSAIKDSEITLSIITDVVPGYQLVGFKSSAVMPEPPTHQDTPISLKFTWPLNHWYLVPEFDNLKWKAETDGGDLSGDISRDLLPKVALGWGLYDEDDNIYKKVYFSEGYRKLEDWPYQGLSYHLDKVNKSTTYKAYPLVRLMGVEMRADKSVDVSVMECPVKITNFEQTNSRYEKDAFTNNGRKFSYKYDCAVTVELTNSENVEDWGYVYEDPDGQLARISLNSYGSPYTDTRYAYYRNEASSTVRLYEYVKFASDSEYYYGEPKDYEVSHQGETVTAGEATNITASSATLTGIVENYDPNEETFQFAFFYSTSSDVMNSSDGKSAVATYDNNGNLTAEISGLKDYTTYYYTLAVKRGESAFEPSGTKSFTTLPVVSTVNNATTTSNSATLSGTCSKGITVTGFSVKKDGESEYATYSGIVDGNGNFSATIDGLDANTTYRYYAFIKDGEKTYPGEEYLFTTKTIPVSVATGDVSNVKANSATLSGTVENYAPSGESVQFVFFYSTNSDVMNATDGKSVVASYDNNGYLTAEISGLTDYTTYYYTLAVKRGESAFEQSEINSFKTLPFVTTLEDVVIDFDTATLKGTCSKGISIAGFSVKKDGESDYTQYSSWADSDGNFAITIDNLKINTKYDFYAFIQSDDMTYRGEEMSFTTDFHLCPDSNHPHKIDLGLPSGTKWACCNVGAINPEESGGYYSWGETYEKTEYSWGTYSLYDENRQENGGYIDVPVDISGTELDVAYVKWGNKWRMPTKTEFGELISVCVYKRINNFDKMFGYSYDYFLLFKGPNGRYLALPQTGLRQNNNPVTDFGGLFYWSSTRDTSTNKEFVTGRSGYRDAFSLSGYENLIVTDYNRTQGFAVRPVWNE